VSACTLPSKCVGSNRSERKRGDIQEGMRERKKKARMQEMSKNDERKIKGKEGD
jgi:hypothetical protein